MSSSARSSRAERDDSLQDLHNSSHHMKAEFNNRFIIHLEISTLPPDNPGRLSSNIGLFNRFQDINLFFVCIFSLKGRQLLSSNIFCAYYCISPVKC